ncbi:MAG TPA: PH domain-containing protein [Rhodothermales bacterium]|nr:PH domain-containing protein [Rhodothermales bacterium]
MYRRLHPLTLVHQIAEQMPTIILLAVSLTFGAGRAGEAIGTLAALGISALLYGPTVVIRYVRFRYRITDTAVEVESGVLGRQHRVIPLDRIQTVEVEQPLLARLMGTARVLLLTGSGSGAEATLSYVSLEEAARLRREIRGEGRGERGEDRGETRADSEDPLSPVSLPPSLFTLTRRRLVRAGLYRLSLGYLAVAFSMTEVAGFGPTDIVEWAEDQERLLGQLASPAMLALLGIVLALGLAWGAGFVTTVLRFAGFRLTDDGVRLHTQAGLLSRWERTIPRGRIQAFHTDANPVMTWSGYTRLHAQTLGADRRSGLELLAPLARLDEAETLRAAVQPLAPVEAWRPVSPRHSRRRFVRATLVLLVGMGTGTYISTQALWGLVLTPLLYALARAQARAHVWALTADALHVQEGVLWRRGYVVPRGGVQTAAYYATLMQRRLGLASLIVDTAGGSGRGVVVHDLPEDEAATLLASLRLDFHHRHALEPRAVADEAQVEHGGHGLSERRPLEVEGGPGDGGGGGDGADDLEPPRHLGEQ